MGNRGKSISEGELSVKRTSERFLRMMDEHALSLAQELRANWHRWHDLDRAEAVVELINYGFSRRGLGRIVGCSEGLIRYIEKIGHWPMGLKDMLARGYPTRPVVDAWRKQMRQQSA